VSRRCRVRIVALSHSVAAGQVAVGTSLAELFGLKSKVVNAETRVRVDALHQVWSIALGSDNRDVKLPAINALVRAVRGSGSDQASQAAIDLLVASLDSSATIGGFEVRMMAVRAVETIGIDASGIATKAKAMGLLQSYASRGGWEPEAQRRAGAGAAAVQASMSR